MSGSNLGKRRRLVLFAVLAAGLLAVPLGLIFLYETTLDQGELFRFRTAPVDPYDAFRGRYVALGFPTAEATVAAGTRLEPGQEVFVSLEHDAEGFARLGEVSLERPAEASHLHLAVARVSGGKARFELPFDRFYMNELLAPEAERAYRRSAREAWVEVRVYRGRAVIEELYVEGRRIGEVLAEAR